MSKTILVTETCSGDGRLVSAILAGAGHSVIAAMPCIKGSNAAIALQLEGKPNIEVIEMDFDSEQSVNSAVAFTLKKYGPIDVLINNNLILNVTQLYQEVLPSMLKCNRGLIINISGEILMEATRRGLKEYGIETVFILPDSFPYPQSVANAVLAIINMKSGTRPFHTVIKPIR